MIRTMNRRGLLLASVAGISMIGGAALAQDEQDDAQVEQTQESPAAEAAASGDDTIIVTGSRLRRDEFSSASPIQVLNAESASLEGLIDTADIIQGSSIAAGSVQFNNQFGGFVVEGGTGINSISLRGLGAQRSLVLLNGRRPGPSGTRGQVGAFDLNVIPTSIIQRVEILKDGASSVYGSDAVAGVVNVITRTSVEEPELNFQYNQPLEGGGEQFSINGAYGLNFDTGSIALAAEYNLQEDLSLGDREYLGCQQDYIYDASTGERIDREDRSILAGSKNGGCQGLYHNTIIDAAFGTRYIPSPDGVTVGPLAGYRPRANGTYDDGDGIPAFYEDVLYHPLVGRSDAINRNERFSLYGVADFDFDVLGGVKWVNEALFTRRETTAEGSRQFFPLIGGANTENLFGGFTGYVYANDPAYENPFLSVLQPVAPYPSDTEVVVDYYNFASQLDGGFGSTGFLSDWTWTLSGVYSYSDGEYTNKNQIFNDLSGDVRFDADAPMYDPFSNAFLSGNYGDDFYDLIGGDVTGNTIYEQWTATGYVTGPLFTLPAGDVGVVLGAEYRDFSIEDTPSQQSQDGNLWGFTSAQVTEGDDNVAEAFGEIEVPVLAGLPGFEELTFSAAGRVFDYESTGSGEVWEVGFNWQVVPAVRFRGTMGTSYRSPALYELFLGNQTAFFSQINDPCVDYQNSSNELIRQNCASIGIPPDYQGGASSGTIITGGGVGVLEPETSDASTIGVILTPSFTNLSVAVDYFEIEVNDQIAQLGAAGILSGCYNATNFPNEFCNLFDRGDVNSPFAITEIRDSFININEQTTRGIDLTARYQREFDFGTLTVDGKATWTLEDVLQLFDPAATSSFDNNDFNRTIGDPDVVANLDLRFDRGDWTYSWFMDFIGHTSNEPFANDDFTYFGRAAFRQVETEAIWYHAPSIRWSGDKLAVTFGIQNIFDEEPPIISTGAGATRRGNVPLSGTQYSLLGRTAFLRVNKTF